MKNKIPLPRMLAQTRSQSSPITLCMAFPDLGAAFGDFMLTHPEAGFSA